MDDIYIELLLKKCLFFKSKSLFISYNKLNKNFVNKLIEKAKEMGIDDIYEDEVDYDFKMNLLNKLSIEEIKEEPYFKATIWDEYAKRDASFLFLESEMPKLMDDIDPEKIALASYIKRSTKPIYNEKRDKGIISWCIAAYPNELWAKDLFPNESLAYDKLYKYIASACMLDCNDPIECWNKQLNFSYNMANKLNELKIKRLHYTNEVGTDLWVTLPDDYLFASAAEGEGIVNMPSYEIFSSPDYRLTNGIVKSALPLIYNGVTVKDFYIKFKDGKAIEYDAKVGKEILKGIIESDKNACYLGEIALVNHNSPISNTGIVFKTTLFDENASCHLALGAGFNECIKNGLNMSEEELLEHGINQSKNHVDFMIGTSDLNIVGECEQGNVQIFKDGNFCI